MSPEGAVVMLVATAPPVDILWNADIPEEATVTSPRAWTAPDEALITVGLLERVIVPEVTLTRPLLIAIALESVTVPLVIVVGPVAVTVPELIVTITPADDVTGPNPAVLETGKIA